MPQIKSYKLTIGSRIVLEVPLANGSKIMLTGELDGRTHDIILLSRAALIKDPGDLTLFFRGRFDVKSNPQCKIEIYPDEVQIEIPDHGCILYSWPHVLPRLRSE
jgi:hypothetical protein